MIKTTYPIYCGADIYKNSIVATIVTTDKYGNIRSVDRDSYEPLGKCTPK